MNEQRVREIQEAIDAYRRKADANPGGARDRLIATGIWDKHGKLTPEYGGESRKKRRADA